MWNGRLASLIAAGGMQMTAAQVDVQSAGPIAAVADGVQVQSTSTPVLFANDFMSSETLGDGHAAAGGSVEVTGGRDARATFGGEAQLETRRGLSAIAGEGAELTASAVRVSSSSVLEASTAGSVSVSGSEGVSVSSGGGTVRLSPEGEGEFVGFVWESARSFDSFENVVSPSVSDVEELVIVSGAGPYARGASEVSIDLYDGSSW